MAPKKQAEVEISILPVQQQRVTMNIVGNSPLILNRMSEKAKRELLCPKGRKTAADKATNLKHDPVAEFHAAAHRISDPTARTLLAFPSAGFKGAICSAALDMPGARKAQIGRLSWVEGQYVEIFGIPKLFMSVTRSADMNRTPDIRTRVIVQDWAAKLTVSYVVPLLNDTAVANLLAAAGMYIGVGDWRNEKIKGNYGQFTLVSADDAKFQTILSIGGRQAQIEAMNAAEPYDADTTDLLEWFNAEIGRRGRGAQLETIFGKEEEEEEPAEVA